VQLREKESQVSDLTTIDCRNANSQRYVDQERKLGTAHLTTFPKSGIGRGLRHCLLLRRSRSRAIFAGSSPPPSMGSPRFLNSSAKSLGETTGMCSGAGIARSGGFLVMLLDTGQAGILIQDYKNII
jgi:hypothetical protein